MISFDKMRAIRQEIGASPHQTRLIHNKFPKVCGLTGRPRG